MIAAAMTTEQVAQALAQHLAESSLPAWGAVAKLVVDGGMSVLILVGLYRLIIRPPQFIGQFIASQQSQAVSYSEMSTAVKSLAEKDNYQQRELLGVLQVVAEDVRELKAKLK